MGQLDSRSNLVKINLLLVAEGIDPRVGLLIAVGENVRTAASHVLLVQLQRPLDLDLLHAAIFRITLDVGSRQAEALMGVQVIQLLRSGLVKVVLLCLPLVANVDDDLRLLLQQALCSLVRRRANRQLGRCSEENTQLIFAVGVQHVRLALSLVLRLFHFLVEH